MSNATKTRTAPPSMPKRTEAPASTTPETAETTTTKKARVIRTPEQQIADLEAKIAATKRRAARAKAKSDPIVSSMLRSLGAIEKAIVAANGNEAALGVLGGARDVIRDYLTAQGVAL